MTIDDRSLREHLDRRATSGFTEPAPIADVVLARLEREPTQPWWRRPIRRTPAGALIAAAVVVLLVAMALLPSRLLPSGSGSSAEPSAEATHSPAYPVDRPLTLAELDELLSSAPRVRATMIVVADVELHVQAELSCPIGADCPQYLINFGDRKVYVYDLSGRPLTPGPQALRVRDDGSSMLDLLGPVGLGPVALAWTMSQFVAALPDVRVTPSGPVPPGHPGRLYVVDGWLHVVPDMRACLAVGPEDAWPSFGSVCGEGQAWLVPDQSSEPTYLTIPADWVRVPFVSARGVLSGAARERGYWLIDPFVSADECHGCSPAGAAFLLGRITPIAASTDDPAVSLTPTAQP
jgi:hypothetical protein